MTGADNRTNNGGGADVAAGVCHQHSWSNSCGVTMTIIAALHSRVGHKETFASRRPRGLTQPGPCFAIRAMENGGEFERLVEAVVTRFHMQKSHVPPATAEIARFTCQLRQLVDERGLPPPLSADQCGTPGGMAEDVCAPLVARVLAGTREPLLAEAARQLVKACFYPEFKVCRDSFREVTREGACRRQELARVRGRISGSHCVDCPHWVALAPEQHADYLRREWRDDVTIFETNRGVFLPEDFRALRHWLHAASAG
jgi:hypothetical protein